MKTKNLLKVLSIGALGLVALTACEETKAPEDVLKSLILSEDNKVVSSDFAVPNKVQGCDVTWTSSDAAVTFADKDEDFKYAAITRPEEGSKEVTLTATLKSGKKSAKKDFKVTLNAVDVIEVADQYKFAQAGSMVYEDFALDSQYTYELYNALSSTAYRTCTAEMSWSSSNEDVISISEDGKTALVTPQEQKVNVTLTCAFTFNGRTSEYEYRLSVFQEQTAQDVFMRFYDHAGEGDAYNINGYVLWKTEYSASYNNCYVYMVDETYTGGIYLYRVNTTQAIYDQLTLGSGITCTGITSTNYNGLIETNAGGDLTLNNELPAFDLSKATTAIDELLFMQDAEGPSKLLYKESTFVTLSGWAVKSVGDAPDISGAGSGTQTLLTLTKNNVDIKVVISKYVTPFAEALAPQVATIQATYKVGDIVNVHGILGAYNGFQIIATGADSVTKVETESAVTVPAIYGAYQTASRVEIPATLVADTTINLPTITVEGVTATWAAKGSVATLTDNVLVVSPISKAKTVILTCTLTDGTYTFVATFEIFTQALSAEGQVQAALDGLKFTDYYDESTSVTLPTVDTTFANVQYTYALNAEATNASIQDGKLVITQSAQEETVTLTVTATYGEISSSKSFEIRIAAKLDVTLARAIEIALAGEHNVYSSEKYIVTGVIKEVYNTTYGNMYLTDGVNTLTLYGTYDVDGNGYKDMAVKPVAGDVITIQGGLGHYNGTPQIKNGTIIAHYGSQVSIEEANTIAAGQEHNKYTSEYYVITGTVKSIASTKYGNMYITDGTNDFYIYGLYDVLGNRFDAMAAAPAVGDVVVVYSQLGQYNGAAQGKNAILASFYTPENGGGETPEPADPIDVTIAEAITIGSAQTSGVYTTQLYNLTGVISEIQNETYGNVVITDGTDSILIYGLYQGETRYDAMETKPVVGDTITVQAGLGNYNGTPQMKNAQLTAHVPAGGDTPNPEPVETVTVTWALADLTETTYTDKGAITTLNSDFFTVEGTVTTRVNSESAVTSVEIAKASVGGAIVFEMPSAGTFTAVVASSGSSNISFVTLKSGSQTGTDVANNENVIAVYSSGTKTTLTWNLEAGTYYLTAAAPAGTDVSTDDLTTTVGEVTQGNKTISGRTVRVFELTATYEKVENGGGEGGETPTPEPTVQKLTLAEAITIANGQAHDTYTTEVYEITAVVKEVVNATYGNIYLTDGTNDFYLYGLYQNGVRYDAMEVKPQAGDTITVQGGLGKYSSTVQMKNAELVNHVVKVWSDAEKVANDKASLKPNFVESYAADTTVDLPLEVGRFATAVTWEVTAGTTAVITDGKLVVTPTATEETVTVVATLTNGEATDTVTYTFTTMIQEIVTGIESKAIIASQGTLENKVITWTATNFTFENAQKSSTSAIRTSDTDHFRCYASSEVTISGNDGALLTKIVFTATSESYATVLQTSLSNAGYTATVSGSVVTVELAAPTASITFKLSAQSRINNVEVTYQK